ncbi:hypothetical protein F511_24327 [Dorcoceras hygrometricum]|uniref:Uncharacterized protein n=1 Tax=Dorcoceras hygrometricum TaxID=472368 RepID=A0A2Z7AQH0_9LAMI|nr:hypothetical protein F511_24327 [Dorcoceras hygrometricum]
MDVVISRFQRMNPPVFNGDESSEDADSWLHNIIHIFDRAQYDDGLRLRLGLRNAGIDQLNFHSAQLDYLKLLQMGNADPNKTKAGNKYEVKPQYEELSKQINKQHAIINAMNA